MTITLTTQELYQFQEKLQTWYRERSAYVIMKGFELRHDPYDPLARPTYRKIDLDKEMAAWEQEHPKPDWQSLLAEVAAS